MDPNNQTGQNPQGGDEPSLAPQNQADDSPQEGTASQSPEGQSSEGAAPELPKWVHQLAGDLKENPKVNQYQNPNDLVRDYLGFTEKADRMVEIPGDDADEQTRNEFLDRLRPGSPDEYKLTEVPEGLPYSKELEAEFRKMAHERGLTNEQANAIHELNLNRMKANLDGQKKAREEGFNKLKGEWGDGFDGNVKEAQAAVQQIAAALGDDGLAERMRKSGYDTNPEWLRTFYGIRQLIKDDTLVSGSTEGQTSTAADFYPNTDFDS